MISFQEAQNMVLQHSKPLTPIDTSLAETMGLVLAEDQYSPLDLPPFDQSNMDGYAFRYADLVELSSLAIVGSIPAGSPRPASLGRGEAARIFTGAPVPKGADTVVAQEKVKADGKSLTILDESLVLGNNIRPCGAEMEKGKLAMPKMTRLSPAGLGFLASMGIDRVKIFPKPKISLIITGKEIQQIGKSLLPGQVYDSNSLMLAASLSFMQPTDLKTVFVDDELSQVEQAIAEALDSSTVVLLTGGVSVGDYDFVAQAATLNGVSTLFHQVKQKPGKPLYFGKKGETLVFGLPGNPSSVLTCFYIYVLPALEKIMAFRDTSRSIWLPLGKPVKKTFSLTQFLKGWLQDGMVIPLDAQESYRLSSFARANCLICLPETEHEFAEGTLVEVYLIPA